MAMINLAAIPKLYNLGSANFKKFYVIIWFMICNISLGNVNFVRIVSMLLLATFLKTLLSQLLKYYFILSTILHCLNNIY